MDEKLFPDPELFVSEPDPARMKERNNTLLIHIRPVDSGSRDHPNFSKILALI